MPCKVLQLSIFSVFLKFEFPSFSCNELYHNSDVSPTSGSMCGCYHIRQIQTERTWACPFSGGSDGVWLGVGAVLVILDAGKEENLFV